MRKFLSLLFISTFIQSSIAQEVFRFTEGLASGAVHQYGREALYSDALAWQLYQQGLTPKEGTLVIANPTKTNVWTSIKADSNGVFRGQSLGSGYLYLTYNSSKKQTAVIVAAGHSMFYFNGAPHGGD